MRKGERDAATGENWVSIGKRGSDVVSDFLS